MQGPLLPIISESNLDNISRGRMFVMCQDQILTITEQGVG